jgi:nucleoside-specific outer membrane channel protein Tsx
MQFKQWITHLGVGLLAAIFAIGSQAAMWSDTELHVTNGVILDAFKKEEKDTTILTIQHASGHKYGSNFLFVDQSYVKGDELESYMEGYTSVSLGAITGHDISYGVINDVGLIGGINLAINASKMFLLAGVRLGMDLPGFAFANLDFMSYNNVVTSAEDKTEEHTSGMVDFSWAIPFEAGGFSWSLEGHAEYITGRDGKNKKDGEIVRLEDSILAQPQLRMDLGKALGYGAGNVYLGLEYQYWKNKLGQKDQNESTTQLLAVWNF